MKPLLDAALVILVAVPPICTTYALKTLCASGWEGSRACGLYLQQPVLLVNILFGVHIDLTLYLISLAQVRSRDNRLHNCYVCVAWHSSLEISHKVVKHAQTALWRCDCHCVIGSNGRPPAASARRMMYIDAAELQGSTWLIDPYWTLAPPMLAAFWLSHPHATLWSTRQAVSTLLLAVWAARLTHSYLRREGWVLGTREDWRYADMRRQFGAHWVWVQLFAVYGVQHLMLVGLTLPWHSIAFSGAPWSWLDSTATCAAIAGLCVAAVADNALHAHGQSRSSDVLRSGLWGVCRHPNHFGEQLWWWGAWMFAIPGGGAWTGIGTAFNSLCMLQVRRHSAQPHSWLQWGTAMELLAGKQRACKPTSCGSFGVS